MRAFADGLLGGFRGPAVIAVSLRVDINRAAVGELMALPGIGRVRAEAIVLRRVRHGPFRCVDDLCEVDGLGPETVAELRSYATAGTGP